MLPTRLELKNFLAYCSPDPLFFEGIHLACLSGPNGAGKSSLLDAVTWVLWGRARDARSDDELIHLGQEEMQVTLDFLQGPDLYRVQRRRKLGNLRRRDGRRSPGTTALDFFAWDEEARVFRVITEPSIRQTQQAINRLLRLDYATFVNSAFLRQGKADSFTVQPPGKRKEILADILGLEQWAVYEDRAKKKLRVIEDELIAVRARLEDIEVELQQEDTLRSRLEHAETQHQAAEEDERRAYDAFQEFAGADKELLSRKSDWQGVKSHIEEVQKDVQHTEAEIQRTRETLTEYQAIVERSDSIEDGYARLEDARREDQALGDTLRNLREVDKRIHDLQSEIEQQRQNVLRKISTSETIIEEESSRVEHIETIQQEKDDVMKDIVLLDENEERVTGLEAEIVALGEEKNYIQKENKQLREEMDAIKERLDMVEAATEAACPLCGQPLDADHQRELAESFQMEGRSRGDKYRANQERANEIDDLVKEYEQEIRVLQKTIQQMLPLRTKLGGLEQQVADAEKSELRIQEEQNTLNRLRETLDSEAFAEELRIQLAELEQQRESLGYDPETHDAIRSTIDTYLSYQQEYTRLEVARETIPTTEAELSRMQARQERYQKRLQELEVQQIELETEIAALDVRVTEMQRRKEEWNQKRIAVREYRDAMVSLKQRLTSIDNMKTVAEEKRKRETELMYEQGIHEELRKAFSKSGIPALLIDAAIPELEEATNHLLLRMTSGRMAVRFDTRREKKTGGFAETFDIWIADELGQRDYSLYSGGEAFRVNFAIRVALSQLLARRAGAQLRTLFIDEGFGTQDETGRDRLIEAITTIQKDFDLILVITHIDDLRDSFPVRIEVEKQARGSRVMITG